MEMQVNHPSITREMLGDGWSQQLDPSEAASAEYSRFELYDVVFNYFVI